MINQTEASGGGFEAFPACVEHWHKKPGKVHWTKKNVFYHEEREIQRNREKRLKERERG